MGDTNHPAAGVGLRGKIRRRLSSYARLRISETYLYSHDLAVIPTVPADPACLVRLLGIDELALLLEVHPLDLPGLRSRLERGFACYAAFLDGRIAGYGWAQPLGKHFLRDVARWREVRPKEFWIYHCRTAPWARGRRAYPFILMRMLEDYRRQGFERAWIYTGKTNVPSQKGIERAGFVLRERLPALEVGPLILPLPLRMLPPPAPTSPS